MTTVGAQTLTPGKLAAGSNHSLAVNFDGTVRAWGYNNQGQLGNNTQTSTSVPVTVSGLSGVTVVAGGGSHSLALKSDGTVRAWGYNVNGQLGNNSTTLSKVPVTVTGLSAVLDVACGANHSLAVKNDGTVWAWGLNTNGQLGNNSTTQSLIPVQVSGLTDVVAVAAGLSHSYALKSDGTVWAWGLNTYGQLGNNSTTQSLIPVQVIGLSGVEDLASGDHHGLVVKSDDTAWSWGYNNQGQLGNNTQTNSLVPVQVNGLAGVATVAGGSAHSAALMFDGTMRAWGYNNVGQLGRNNTSLSKVPVTVTGLSNMSVIASGSSHTMALKSDGSVWGTGQNNYGQLGSLNSRTSRLPVPVSGFSGVMATAAGANHTLTVKSDGTVWSSGYNNQGQLGNNTQTNASVPVAVSGMTGAVSVAGGGSHSLAVRNDGTVRAWGYNSNGQLGNNSTTLSKVPVTVTGLGGVTAVSAGNAHSLALKSDGTVWSWGLNTNGQLGDNSVTQRLIPVPVSGLSGIIAVATGSSYSLALKNDGTVWAWGLNTNGQLGNNSTVQSLVPVQVSGLTGVTAIAAGSSHALALKSDGTVVSWGYNNQGQLGNNTQTNSLVPVTVSGLANVIALAGGGSHSLALKSDGTVWSWGYNAQGQLGNNSTTLSKVPIQVSGMIGALAVAAGTNYSVALKEDGMLATWGDSPYGQLAEGMSAYPTSLVAIKAPAFNVLHAKPSVVISGPANNTVLAMGQTQTVDVNFTMGEGPPASVSLYHQGILLGTDTAAPFSFSFQPWSYGDFSLTAFGIDSLGYDSLRSTAVNIKVPFDSDLDGLPDWWEMRYFSTLSTSPYLDADNDKLLNIGEYYFDTLPDDTDTDNDGLNDAGEFAVYHNVPVSNLVSITANKTQRSVELSWQNNYASATSNIIQRSMDDGATWVDAATVAATTTGHIVTGLQPGVNYQFRVLTVSVYGSFPSNSVTERTLIQRISAGAQHRLAINADGTVLAWGSNQSGQLGNNSTTSSPVPVLVSGLSDVHAVSAGGDHSLALKGDGTVWAWGGNNASQLGNDSTSMSMIPIQVPGLNDVVAIAAGSASHSMALKSDGTVWVWGSNIFGQLGNNSTTNSRVPIQVSGVTGVSSLAAGYFHSLVVKSDGTVWAWGDNSSGQLGDNSNTRRLVPVQVSGLSGVAMVAGGSYHSLALKLDGTALAWGSNFSGQLGDGTNVESWVPVQSAIYSEVKEISCGSGHSLAVMGDGTVLAWGDNSYGALGDNSVTKRFSPVQMNGMSDVVSVAGGGYQTLAMKADGALWTCGEQLGGTTPIRMGIPVQVRGQQNIHAADAGSHHNLMLKNDGTVWTVGQNTNGQLGNNTTVNSATSIQVSQLSGVVAVSGGLAHSLAVLSDGTLRAWGLDGDGQLGNDYPTYPCLRPVTVGEMDDDGNVTPITEIKAVAAGGQFTLALKTTGTVWAWGLNTSGQLGNNIVTRTHTPMVVAGLSGVASVAAGNTHAIALKTDGTVWTWGANNNGQLGINSTTLSRVPVPVPGLSDVVAVAAGDSHSLALKSDGTVWTWGYNAAGQLGNNTTVRSLVPIQVTGLNNVVSVSCGANHSLAVKSDGTVWTWGSNASGQLGNNSLTNSLVPVQINELDGVISVSGGQTHSLAVKADGTLVTWGDSTYGQLGVGLSASTTTLVMKRVLDINALHPLPLVEITSPADNTVVPLGENQLIEVSVTPGDGAITSVSFYHYGVLLGTDMTAPYTLDFEPTTWGDFPITAEGVDSLGVISKRSVPVTLKVPYDIHSDYDSDGDGVHDSWEIAQYGNIMQHGANDIPDTDGDTYSDWVETLAETDANDAVNVPFPAGTPVNPSNIQISLQSRNRHMIWNFTDGWYSYPDPNDNEVIISGYNRFGYYAIGNARGETKYLAEWVDNEYTTGISVEACMEAVAGASVVGTMPAGTYPNITNQLPPFSFAEQWASVSSYSEVPGESLSPSSSSLVSWPWNQGDSEGWTDYTQGAFYDETIAVMIQPVEGPPEIVSAPRIYYTQLRAKSDSGQTYKRSRTYVVVKEERWGSGPSVEGALPSSVESQVLGVATISLNAGAGAKSKVTFQPTSVVGSGPGAFAGPDEVKVQTEPDGAQALVMEPKVSAAHAASDRRGAWIKLVPVEIKEVSFAGGNYHELKSDDGNTTYNAPQWVDVNGDGTATTNTSNGEKNYPVSFTRNTKPQVGGKVKIAGLPSGQSVKIKASSAQGLQIPETSVTPAADGTLPLPLTTASNNLINSIQFHNADDTTAFKIDWEISIGSGGWSVFGSTKHTVYITRADPIKTATGLMRETLFNLGCRNAKGKGNAAQAVVDAIYDDFKDRNVQKVKPSSGSLDGVGMRYWNNPPTAGFETEDLLATGQVSKPDGSIIVGGDGRCGAWTRIFTDVLRSQGIDAQITAFYAPPPNLQTLSPAIQAKYPNYSGQITYLFGTPPQPAPLILVKDWNIANTFAPIDNQGIAAQGNSNPQAYFGDHFVVEYGGKYYDPSYGSNVFATQREWEDAALDAFGLMIVASPALPDQAQANPALPQGVTIWMWQPDPKGSAETIPQPFNY